MSVTFSSKYKTVGLAVWKGTQWALGRVHILEEAKRKFTKSDWSFADMVEAVSKLSEVRWIY